MFEATLKLRVSQQVVCRQRYLKSISIEPQVPTYMYVSRKANEVLCTYGAGYFGWWKQDLNLPSNCVSVLCCVCVCLQMVKCMRLREPSTEEGTQATWVPRQVLTVAPGTQVGTKRWVGVLDYRPAKSIRYLHTSRLIGTYEISVEYVDVIDLNMYK